MAEHSVEIEYASKWRRLALHLLRMAFPIWGLLPFFMVLWALFAILTSSLVGATTAKDVSALTMLFLASLVVLTSLLCIRFLEKSKLLIDKNGIEQPKEIMHFSLRKSYLPWKDVVKVTVSADKHNAHWKKSKLVIFSRHSKPCLIQLGRIQPAELEQLLVSIDVFAPQAEQDSSLSALKEELKQTIRQGQSSLLGPADRITYTELWEEELSRRFRAAAFMPLEVGLIMRGGSLTIVRQLALGGLSAVYLAQLAGSKLVTLKESVVPEDADGELKEKAREMFAREAQFLMRLNHANIVPVLDYFVEHGRSYLMLDYISGQDLRQYVRQNGSVREALAIEWSVQIAAVIVYLHSQDPPILHRDLTPDNLIVRSDGQIVVIDFGAANEFLGNATGTFVGKQSYIAPEQFRGKATTQSDIYAFGGTLYYLLTGQDPEALTQSEPDKIKEEISPGLVQLVKSCTALEAADRPQTASLVLDQLVQMSKATNQGGPVHNDA